MKLKTWSYRIVITVLLAELAYLVLFNMALHLPLTQTLVNQIKPEKFSVTWEKAWTWLPFRVHAQGISANGQTSSQQWQAEVPAASASISILPLLGKSVKIHSVEASDIEYFQRPRPKPDKDYAATRAFFPPIKGREIDTTPVTPVPKKKGNGWKIVVQDIHATGSHEFWIFQIRGRVTGTLQADANYETRSGPFSLEDGQMDLRIDSLAINDGQGVSNAGFLKGTLEFTPFVPSENRGIRSFGFMKLDAELESKVANLNFLNFYLSKLQGLNIDGNGVLGGIIHYDQGKLLPSTRLAVSSNELRLDLHSYEASGTGTVEISVTEDKPDQLVFEILFATIKLLHEGDDTPHFTGEAFKLTTGGNTRLLPWDDRLSGARAATFSIPRVTIPDLGVYQRYIPDNLALRLNGGLGKLESQTEVTPDSLKSHLTLDSDAADISYGAYRFTSNLDLGLDIHLPSLTTGKLDISGSSLRLTDARLANEDRGNTEPWNTRLSIDRGKFVLPIHELAPEAGTFRQVSQTVKGSGIKSLLEKADADIRITGDITQLSWINVLFSNPYDLSLKGSGELTADLKVEEGLAASDSLIRVESKQLEVNILDYSARGDGMISLAVLEGGEHPDLDLQIELRNGLFKRQDEEEEYIEDVTMRLQAQALDRRKDQAGSNIDRLRLQIPEARVADMSAYNDYLPANSPLQFLEGQADLKADIVLQRDSADGFVRLKTGTMRARLDEQELSGELDVDIAIQDGIAKNMDFDISGSTITLDKLRVFGTEKNYDREDWSARFLLSKGHAIWKKPVYVNAEAELEIKDSRPLVAMFSNQNGKHQWIEKMLTVEDIQGTAEMRMENGQITIPHAFTSSDKVDAGAKGIINSESAEGIFYGRFRKLDAVLKIRDGNRNVDIIGARKKFNEYSTDNR